MSLTRLSLWRKGFAEARGLRSLFASFTEGFETRDLRDAKAILNTRGRIEQDTKVRAQRLSECVTRGSSGDP